MAFYLPTKVFDSNWIFCSVEEYASKYPHKDGKWMMFFPMSEMDARWDEACHLYRSGKLVGVRGMKASTSKQNEFSGRLHAHNEGIIIFYVGPSEDKANVLKCGKNILNHIYYPREKFFYKSDKPHLINHSNECKHIYQINTSKHYSNELKRMNMNAKRRDFHRKYYSQYKVTHVIA